MGTNEKWDVSPIELVNEKLEKKNEELMAKVQELDREKQESQTQWQQEKEGYETGIAGLREELQKYKRKNKGNIWLNTTMILMLCGICLLWYISYSDYKSEYEMLESKYSNRKLDYEMLKSEYTLMEEKYHRIEPAYNFYYEYAVVLPSDGSNTYHRYECEKLDRSNFLIYNINAVKAMSDKKPCSFCFENEEKTE